MPSDDIVLTCPHVYGGRHLPPTPAALRPNAAAHHPAPAPPPPTPPPPMPPATPPPTRPHDLPRPEAVAESIAAGQHGVVTRRQLLDAGLSHWVIDRRLRAGRLEAVFRGVYRVVPMDSRRGREMAALLACGPDAALSHESALALRDLGGPGPRARAVHIGLRRGHRRSRPGIRLHELPTLVDADIAVVEGLRVTTVTRTLFDVAAQWKIRTLERAVAEALERELTSVDALRHVVERHAGRPGTRRLRHLLTDEGPARTRSELEARFLERVRRARVAAPQTNVRIAGHEVDFFWPDARLVVELDGFPYHSGRAAFERDRSRDADLAARGIRVMRVTWRALADEPEAVLVRLGGALLAGGVDLRPVPSDPQSSKNSNTV